MKKITFAALTALSPLIAQSQVLTTKEISNSANQWLCYRTNIKLDKKPKNLKLEIGADSKYWLWINGVLQIREGGLKRGPNPNDTYCDIIENCDALKKGDNSIAVLVWHFGKDGFSHKNSGTPGLSFSIINGNTKTQYTDNWKVKSHPAFYNPKGEQPNYRLPESNIGFDASKEILFYQPDFDDSQWENAKNISLKDAGWNNLRERPIPQWKDFGLKKYDRIEKDGDKIIAYLPYNAQVTPYMKIKSKEGEIIDIRTDNYKGGSANNVYAEYITKSGINEFECKGWMNGHNVVYTIPSSVEVLELKYRESGFNTEFSGSFWCSDSRLTSLWNKSQRTLYITMRDTYMDCPDRERAQWWGDVVNELGEAFYALDENAHLLTRKGIMELMDWQRSDSTIYAPVPSGNYNDELPMQMLASVGYYGFWTYYLGTGDKSTIEYVFPKVKKYIHLWKIDKEGFVISRKGGWTWGDWGDNKDMELLFNQWYIIALDGYANMANLMNDKAEQLWAKERADHLRKVFHAKYWTGNYYRSPFYTGQTDDRAQALSVVSNTLPSELYPKISSFFENSFHSSPYMEKYVLQALCMMGNHQQAIDRMKNRYGAMIDSHLTTLWEGWGIGNEGFGGGSYNHAWSGGPLTILSSYIAGITIVEPGFKTFNFSPNMADIDSLKTDIPLSSNRFIKLKAEKNEQECKSVLEVPKNTKAIISIPVGFNNVSINGKPSKDGVELKSGKWNIIFN